MFEKPIAANQIRVRLHWGDSVEELEEDVNSNLESYPKNAIYGMDYQMAIVPGADNKLHARHFIAVFFHP